VYHTNVLITRSSFICSQGVACEDYQCTGDGGPTTTAVHSWGAKSWCFAVFGAGSQDRGNEHFELVFFSQDFRTLQEIMMVMTVMMMVLLKIVAEVIVQKAGLPKRRAGAVKTIKRVAVPMTVTWQLPKAVDSMVYFLQIFVVNSLAFSEFHGKKTSR